MSKQAPGRGCRVSNTPLKAVWGTRLSTTALKTSMRIFPTLQISYMLAYDTARRPTGQFLESPTCLPRECFPGGWIDDIVLSNLEKVCPSLILWICVQRLGKRPWRLTSAMQLHEPARSLNMCVVKKQLAQILAMVQYATGLGSWHSGNNF